jgi:hypothetical protein
MIPDFASQTTVHSYDYSSYQKKLVCMENPFVVQSANMKGCERERVLDLAYEADA